MSDLCGRCRQIRRQTELMEETNNRQRLRDLKEEVAAEERDRAMHPAKWAEIDRQNEDEEREQKRAQARARKQIEAKEDRQAKMWLAFGFFASLLFVWIACLALREGKDEDAFKAWAGICLFGATGILCGIATLQALKGLGAVIVALGFFLFGIAANHFGLWPFNESPSGSKSSQPAQSSSP